MLFQDLGSRQVVADFSGGTLSSDGGVLFLRQTDENLGLTLELARCFVDLRDARFVDHALEEMLAQRIYGLGLGCEDLNDHERLRLDPLLATACGKEDPLGLDRWNPADRGIALAAPCTLNRLELSNNKQSRCHKLPHDPQKVEACLLKMGVRCLPKHAEEVVVDLDAMGHLVHGMQEGRHFNAYYGDYCYLPLYAFVGDIPLWAQLRTSDHSAAEGVVPALEKIVAAIRQRCRKARIIVRGDSGFGREEIMAWCEGQQPGVYYCLGLAKNSVLVEKLAGALADARARRCLSGAAQVRVFREFEYRTQTSWSRSRRVIGKAEVMAAGDNPRFVVTNLPAGGFKGEEDRERFAPQRLYEEAVLRPGRHGEPAQAAGTGFAGGPAEHASFGQQPTAVMAGHLWVFVAGASADAGFGGDGPGTGDGGQCAFEAAQSGGASAGECAPGVRATEQRLSLPGTVSPLSSAADESGARQWLKRSRQISKPHGVPSAIGELSSKLAENQGF